MDGITDKNAINLSWHNRQSYVFDALNPEVTLVPPKVIPNMMTSSNGSVFRVTGPVLWVSGEFPLQRPVTRSFDVSLICAGTNGWVNNRYVGDLNYDVTVMKPVLVYCQLDPRGRTTVILNKIKTFIFTIEIFVSSVSSIPFRTQRANGSLWW